MNEKDRLFSALDAAVQHLKDDLGRDPSDVDIISHLALMFGVFAGGFAEKHPDPKACLDRVFEPARKCAKDTLAELTQ